MFGSRTSRKQGVSRLGIDGVEKQEGREVIVGVIGCMASGRGQAFEAIPHGGPDVRSGRVGQAAFVD